MTLTEKQSSAGTSAPRGSSEDSFRILLATDIHLGYGEKENHIGQDSFTTFEEILQIAQTRGVDFILLGGDLFHHAEPSIKTLNECIRLLRLYALGDREIKFEFMSNQSANFPNSLTKGVNYEDTNLNVSIPIFTIHGNHDDVIGNTSALDVLSSTGLINYFGQWNDLTNIKVSPIILKKGNTKLALYGLNHIPDRRLASLMASNKFNIDLPQVLDDVFTMLVLHQNRADRGSKNYVVENTLPAFLHFILWGHEHDCRIEPEPLGTGTWISQPGSSVATSLCEGEAIQKKVGILEIRGLKFKITPIALRTVRPFIFRSIEIKDYEDDISKMKGDMRDRVEKLLDKIVKEMIAEVKYSGHAKQPKLPLLRLRVSYDDNQYLINTKRFGQNYNAICANPEDLLLFKKNITRMLKPVKHEPNQDVLDAAIKDRDLADRVEDVVANYFKQCTEEKDKLKLFDMECMTEACRLIVDREDEWGAEQLLKHSYDCACKHLIQKKVPEDRIKEELKRYNERESKEALEEGKRLVEAHQNQGNVAADSDEEPPAKKAATRGRGRGRGAASTSTRGRNASPANDAANTSIRGTRGGRGKKAAAQPSIAAQLSHRSTQNKPKRNFLSDSEDDESK